jgi:hypothetical protein
LNDDKNPNKEANDRIRKKQQEYLDSLVAKKKSKNNVDVDTFYPQ